MSTTKKRIVYILFMLIFINTAYAQNSERADEYLRIADNFKKEMKPDSAILFYEKAAGEFRTIGNTEKFVHAYTQTGVILTRQDNYEKAQTYLDQALATGLASLDTTTSLFLATTYLALGVNYSAQENYPQSLHYHNKALAIRLLKLGEYHADVATSYGNIGNVYFNNKEYEKAIAAHEKAMNIREKLFGSTGVEVIQSYTNLGNAYKALKDYKTSLTYYEKALQNKIIQVGPGHKDLVRFYKNVSDTYYRMGNTVQGDFYKIKSEEVVKN
jgi:tetratricopeptide (TPR) repeat protein